LSVGQGDGTRRLRGGRVQHARIECTRELQQFFGGTPSRREVLAREHDFDRRAEQPRSAARVPRFFQHAIHGGAGSFCIPLCEADECEARVRLSPGLTGSPVRFLGPIQLAAEPIKLALLVMRRTCFGLNPSVG
jgi:hypothetical protein